MGTYYYHILLYLPNNGKYMYRQGIALHTKIEIKYQSDLDGETFNKCEISKRGDNLR